MQINSQYTPKIYFHKTHFQPNSTNLKLKPQLQYDTVSFSGNCNFLNLPCNLTLKKIKDAISNPEYFLGKGSEARVYRIPDTEYCVRISHLDNDYVEGPLKFISLDKNLNEADKINHTVAKFGKKSSILHYLEGEPLSTHKTTAEKVIENTQKISEMPIESFQKLFKQICHAYKNNMMFDHCHQNVIFNQKDKTITAIDFYKNEYGVILKPLSYIYDSLIPYRSLNEQRKVIAGKIINAGINELEPRVKPCYPVTNFDFERLLLFLEYRENYSLDHKLMESLTKKIDKIVKLKIKELEGQNVKVKLEANIKEARNLIKQIF